MNADGAQLAPARGPPPAGTPTGPARGGGAGALVGLSFGRARRAPPILRHRSRARRVRRRLKDILVEYGIVALVVHYLIFGLVLVGSYVAMRTGWRPAGGVANAGTWAAAYVLTKVVQPLRIAVTLALTPMAARLYERVTGRRPGGLGGLFPAADAAKDPDAA